MASSSASSALPTGSSTPLALWSRFTRRDPATGFSPLALTASLGVACAGGFALAYTLWRERYLQRDAPCGSTAGKELAAFFKGLREGHAAGKRRREAAKKKAAAAAASSSSSSSSGAAVAGALSDDEFILRRPTLADVESIAQQTFDAFNEWNRSVGLPPEWPSLDMCRGVMASCIQDCVCLAAFHTGTGECLGSVVNVECDLEHGAVGCGPWSAKWGQLHQGVGRRLVEEVCAMSIRHGAKSLRLNQIAANLTAYSLYSSLGFVTREAITVWRGAISAEAIADATRAGDEQGYTVRTMTESDLPTCDALHQEALGISRKVALLKGVTEPYEPWRVAMMIVLDRDGSIIGYTTGLFVLSHTVVRCPIAFRFLIARATELFQKTTPDAAPFMHTCSRLYPEVDRWLLQSGVRIHRANNLMVLGEWQPIVHERFIYAPNIEY